jgi:hypothetical protein
MAITLPKYLDNPGGNLNTILQEIMANKQKQQELAETGLYHRGELDLKRQQLDNIKANQPLKTDLIKAQIEAQKALANQRNTAANLGTGLTKANVTKNQGIIQAINNVSPLLKEISNPKFHVPNQLLGKYLHPDWQRNYEAKTAKIVDSLISALKLPSTNESIHLVKDIIQRGKFESDKAYRKRLNDELSDLSKRKVRAEESIKSGIFGSESSDIGNPSADSNWIINDEGELVEA